MTFYVDWKFIIIALMVEILIFTALALFLNPLSNLWSSIIFCCTSEIYYLVFLIVMGDSFGIWPLFSLFIFLWNRKPWLDNFMFIITLVCSKLWIWMGRHFRYILHWIIFRGTSNCVQRIFENKHLFHNYTPPPPPPILNSYPRMKA